MMFLTGCLDLKGPGFPSQPFEWSQSFLKHLLKDVLYLVNSGNKFYVKNQGPIVTLNRQMYCVSHGKLSWLNYKIRDQAQVSFLLTRKWIHQSEMEWNGIYCALPLPLSWAEVSMVDARTQSNSTLKELTSDTRIP